VSTHHHQHALERHRRAASRTRRTQPIPTHPPHDHAPFAITREYRVLLGHLRRADVFVDTSKIGTDALFERCTHFAPVDLPMPKQQRRRKRGAS